MWFHFVATQLWKLFLYPSITKIQNVETILFCARNRMNIFHFTNTTEKVLGSKALFFNLLQFPIFHCQAQNLLNLNLGGTETKQNLSISFIMIRKLSNSRTSIFRRYKNFLYHTILGPNKKIHIYLFINSKVPVQISKQVNRIIQFCTLHKNNTIF